MKFEEIRVKEGMDFKDISAEEFRIYHLDNGEEIKVERPIALKVSETGHRIICEDGTSKYVYLKGVQMITWKVKEGKNHFDV
jgi:hypothetical protein